MASISRICVEHGDRNGFVWTTNGGQGDKFLQNHLDIVSACVKMSGSLTATIDQNPTARECHFVCDKSGVLYCLAPEHGYLYTERTENGYPIHFDNLCRAYPERVIVSVYPPGELIKAVANIPDGRNMAQINSEYTPGDQIRLYDLYYSPTGQQIGSVVALSSYRARQMAPAPYADRWPEVYALAV